MKLKKLKGGYFYQNIVNNPFEGFGLNPESQFNGTPAKKFDFFPEIMPGCIFFENERIDHPDTKSK